MVSFSLIRANKNSLAGGTAAIITAGFAAVSQRAADTVSDITSSNEYFVATF